MEKQLISIDMINNDMDMLCKMYDNIRLVDPIGKKTLCFNCSNSGTGHKCYSIWNSEKSCENCISMRAFREKEIYFKLEYMQEKIFMITAVPVQSGEQIVVFEMLKDVTGSIAIDESQATGSKLLDIISSLNQLQIRDSLTGLFNRRYIDERLPIDMINNAPNSSCISLILADIDRFKAVNDTYGHIAGDHVLKEFAAMITSCMNEKNSWVARYGGEEFLIVLNGSDMEKAENIAENIRKTVESSKVNYKNSIIAITSSFGVTSLHPGMNITPEAFIDAADKNLYKAKSTGRNKVVSGIIPVD